MKRELARKDGGEMLSRLNTARKRVAPGMKFHRGNSIKSNIPGVLLEADSPEKKAIHADG